MRLLTVDLLPHLSEDIVQNIHARYGNDQQLELLAHIARKAPAGPTLEHLARHRLVTIRSACVDNPNITPELLAQLREDKSVQVRKHIEQRDLDIQYLFSEEASGKPSLNWRLHRNLRKGIGILTHPIRPPVASTSTDGWYNIWTNGDLNRNIDQLLSQGHTPLSRELANIAAHPNASDDTRIRALSLLQTWNEGDHYTIITLRKAVSYMENPKRLLELPWNILTNIDQVTCRKLIAETLQPHLLENPNLITWVDSTRAFDGTLEEYLNTLRDVTYAAS